MPFPQLSRAAVPADQQSVLPTVRGLPWWGAVLLAAIVTAIGAAIDSANALSSTTLGATFNFFYFVGCIVAALAVRRRALFTAAAQPPLIAFLVGVLTLYWLNADSTSGLRRLIFKVLVPIAGDFPWIAATFVVTLLLVAARWYLGHRAENGQALTPGRGRNVATTAPAGDATTTRSGRATASASAQTKQRARSATGGTTTATKAATAAATGTGATATKVAKPSRTATRSGGAAKTPAATRTGKTSARTERRATGEDAPARPTRRPAAEDARSRPTRRAGAERTTSGQSAKTRGEAPRRDARSAATPRRDEQSRRRPVADDVRTAAPRPAARQRPADTGAEAPRRPARPSGERDGRPAPRRSADERRRAGDAAPRRTAGQAQRPTAGQMRRAAAVERLDQFDDGPMPTTRRADSDRPRAQQRRGAEQPRRPREGTPARADRDPYRRPSPMDDTTVFPSTRSRNRR